MKRFAMAAVCVLAASCSPLNAMTSTVEQVEDKDRGVVCYVSKTIGSVHGISCVKVK